MDTIEELRWARRLAESGSARVLRQGAGLSLMEVAREIDVTPSAISRWERGLRRPHGEPALRWAALLRGLAR
ncbi:MAG: helix-turn-helix domain-containing protein [Actinomycetota bacterium]